MVRPTDFAFNQQTGSDNEFQQQAGLSAQALRSRAIAESLAMVDGLRAKGIEVVILDAGENLPPTPDAVFPNNWFTTTAKGDLLVYPMATENRRAEVKPDLLQALLCQSGNKAKQIIDVRTLAASDEFLEGTGVLIFDHQRQGVYAALSQRCHPELLARYCQQFQYELTAFETCLPSGSPVYHTNVMMSLGDEFAVICSEVVESAKRGAILTQLSQHRQVFDINLEQLQHFCGNVLQICNHKGEKFIAMSQTAYQGFSLQQRSELSQYGELLAFDIQHIEQTGGGSVRCMMAEIFF